MTPSIKTMSSKEYHDNSAISSTLIRCASKCLATAYDKYFKPEREPDTPTPAMIFGSAAHKLLLEPDDFFTEFSIAPISDKRTKEGKELWVSFESENKNKTVITNADYEVLQKMITALKSHPLPFKLLRNGNPEQSIEWIDDETGLALKARHDYRHADYIVDYKTVADASLEAFQRTLVSHGYHQQAAHYLDSEIALTGHDHRTFVFIAQEKTPPYPAAVYVLDQKSIEAGRKENRRALRAIQKCLETGVWPSYHADQPIDIGLPKWAFKQEELV